MLSLLFIACTTQEPVKETLAPTQMVESNPTEKQALQKEAISIIQRFGGQLKPKLKAAIQEGGPENAIEVCAEHAPKIAKQLSEETGWSVSRVSLKNRNPAAVPDDWEKEILEHWDKEVAKGVDVGTLAQGEILEKEFRFMKAQKAEGLCLTCHGETLAPAVQAKLKEKYPQDLATGYSLGQVRGAFSVSKILNE